MKWLSKIIFKHHFSREGVYDLIFGYAYMNSVVWHLVINMHLAMLRAADSVQLILQGSALVHGLLLQLQSSQYFNQVKSSQAIHASQVKQVQSSDGLGYTIASDPRLWVEFNMHMRICQRERVDQYQAVPLKLCQAEWVILSKSESLATNEGTSGAYDV